MSEEGQVVAPVEGQVTPPAEGNWYGGANEDNTAYIQNKGWGNADDMVQSYHNLEKFAGGSKNLMEMPGADATPEQWENIHPKYHLPLRRMVTPKQLKNYLKHDALVLWGTASRDRVDQDVRLRG